MIGLIFLIGCTVGGYWNDVTVKISVTPNNPNPSEDVTVKCSNYNLFDYKTVAKYEQIDEISFYKKCFNVFQNIYCNNQFEYSSSRSCGAVLKNKKSDREAVYTLSSNVVSCCIYNAIKRKSTADGCDKNNLLFDNLIYSPSFIHINYPQKLTFTKNGNKVTITSTNPFFDEATFSKNKAQNLANVGYHIVWYTAKDVIPKGYIYYPNHNVDKKPVPKDNIDFDTLTPTSVTFTVPDDAVTGTIHVINEGGFVVDGTNDIGLVGNVENAPAYYSTATELTITE